jgi:hypothetical protein
MVQYQHRVVNRDSLIPREEHHMTTRNKEKKIGNRIKEKPTKLTTSEAVEKRRSLIDSIAINFNGRLSFKTSVGRQS